MFLPLLLTVRAPSPFLCQHVSVSQHLNESGETDQMTPTSSDDSGTANQICRVSWMTAHPRTALCPFAQLHGTVVTVTRAVDPLPRNARRSSRWAT